MRAYLIWAICLTHSYGKAMEKSQSEDSLVSRNKDMSLPGLENVFYSLTQHGKAVAKSKRGDKLKKLGVR